MLNEPCNANSEALDLKPQCVKHTLLLGAFWVIFLWGIWSKGTQALGVNATLFLAMCLYSLDRYFGTSSPFKRLSVWNAPLLLGVLSYTFFENPFLKWCNILFIPAALAVSKLSAKPEEFARLFSSPLNVLRAVLKGWILPLFMIPLAALSHFACVQSWTAELKPFQSARTRSVLKGALLLIGLSVFIVIPLLGSADATFATRFAELYQAINRFFTYLFEQELFARVIGALIVSVLVLAGLLALSRISVEPNTSTNYQRDSISGGIVVGGIMLLYVFFLWIQFERLWTNTLPLSFSETESYVKSGFWQLISLSILNIGLVMTYFRRTAQPVQQMLLGFICSSMLLMFSAAHRMLLYVTLYGLSYEKFYASYTVLYCIAVFALMLVANFRENAGGNILKQCVLLLVWMYGVVSILPTEQIVARSNLALSARPQSRIHLSDLQMLSIDALPFIRAHQEEFLNQTSSDGEWSSVRAWIRERQRELSKKHFYEHSLSSLAALGK